MTIPQLGSGHSISSGSAISTGSGVQISHGASISSTLETVANSLHQHGIIAGANAGVQSHVEGHVQSGQHIIGHHGSGSGSSVSAGGEHSVQISGSISSSHNRKQYIV